MAFDAREYAAKVREECGPFEFIDMAGLSHSVINIMMVDSNTNNDLASASHAGDSVGVDAIMRDIWGEVAWGAANDMPAGVTAQLLQTWNSGVTEAGKEPSLPEPRNREERRSTPTVYSEGLPR